MGFNLKIKIFLEKFQVYTRIFWQLIETWTDGNDLSFVKDITFSLEDNYNLNIKERYNPLIKQLKFALWAETKFLQQIHSRI